MYVLFHELLTPTFQNPGDTTFQIYDRVYTGTDFAKVRAGNVCSL